MLKFWKILVACVLVSNSSASAEDLNNPTPTESDQMTKIWLVSNFETSHKAAFLELFSRYGTEEIGRVELTENPLEAHLIVYFLENWNSLRLTRGYNELSGLFETLGALTDQPRAFLRADFPEVGRKDFVLYSFESSGVSSLKCFVLDIISTVETDGQSKPFEKC